MTFSFTALTRRIVLLAGLLLGLVATTWAQAPAWQAVIAAAPLTASSSAVVAATIADANGDVYVAGTFSGTISLGTATFTSNGSEDAFVAKWLAATQRFAWVQRSAGSGQEHVTALATNGLEVYVTGYFENTSQFGGYTLTSAGSSDVFVVALTDLGSSATLKWTKRAGGPGADQATALTTGGGIAYVVGTFEGTAAFDTSSRTSVGASDVFLVEIVDGGLAGYFGWVQTMGSPTNDYASGVATQGFNLYVTGLFSGTMTLGALSLTNAGAPAMFIAKLALAGISTTFVWAQKAGATSVLVPNALVVQGALLYVAGRFQGTATFGTLSVPNATTAGGAYDAFVAKLIDTGSGASYAWAYGAGGPLTDYVNALAVQGNRVYIAGGYRGTSSFGGISLTSIGTADDAFVARLTDTGSTASFAWALSAGGADSDNALTLAPTSTAVYVGGWVYGAAAFGSQTVGTAGLGQSGFLTSLPDATGLATTETAATPTHMALSPTPTPSGTLATVQLPAGLAASEATLTLLDALGRVVRTRTTPIVAGSQQATFDVAGLAPGVYALRVAVGERLGTARLVVE